MSQGERLSDAGCEQGKQSLSSAEHDLVFKVFYRLESSCDLSKAVEVQRQNAGVSVSGQSKNQRGIVTWVRAHSGRERHPSFQIGLELCPTQYFCVEMVPFSGERIKDARLIPLALSLSLMRG